MDPKALVAQVLIPKQDLILMMSECFQGTQYQGWLEQKLLNVYGGLNEIPMGLIYSVAEQNRSCKLAKDIGDGIGCLTKKLRQYAKEN